MPSKLKQSAPTSLNPEDLIPNRLRFLVEIGNINEDEIPDFAKFEYFKHKHSLPSFQISMSKEDLHPIGDRDDIY